MKNKHQPGGNLHHKYRMARRANGLDLSEAFIIVDNSAIKNTQIMRNIFLAHSMCPNIGRHRVTAC